MESIFNFKRVKSLFLSFINQNRTKLLWRLLLTCIGAQVVMILMSPVIGLGIVSFRYVILFAFIFVNVFSALNEANNLNKVKDLQAHYLLVPSSVLEKVIVNNAVIITYILISLLLFKVMDAIFIDLIYPVISNLSFESSDVLQSISLSSVGTIEYGDFSVLLLVMFTIFFSNLHFIGSLSEKKAGNVLKGVVFFTFLFFIPKILDKIFLGDGVKFNFIPSFPFTDTTVKNVWNDEYTTQLSSGLSIEYLFYFCFLPVLFLVISVYYFKLKEKEV